MTRKLNRREMPDRIDDTPEDIASAVLGSPPKSVRCATTSGELAHDRADIWPRE